MPVTIVSNMIPIQPPDYLDWFDLSSRPLLDLARKNASTAYNPRIEWLVDKAQPFMIGEPRFKSEVWHNFTQILRQPFCPDRFKGETFEEAMKIAAEKILDDAEWTLWYGKPKFSAGDTLHAPCSFCGGVMHYLRRRLYENDTVILRELRPLFFRRFTDFSYEGEWIWEFSLQVNPGHYQRGMKPVCLPPARSATTPRAWAQGSSLEEESK